MQRGILSKPQDLTEEGVQIWYFGPDNVGP
jgi:hypothetical protein